MWSARASRALVLATCVGCNADGLLLLTVDHAADDIEVALFEDPNCNALPFVAGTAVTRRNFDTTSQGDAPQVGMYVAPAWHERAVRVEITTSPVPRYGCVCARLPGGGETRTLDLALSEVRPAVCGAVGPGPDGGAHGDNSPGDPIAGDPIAGDPSAGDPNPGDPNPGDPSLGDPSPGDPNPGDPAGLVYAPVSWDDTSAVVVFYGLVTPRNAAADAETPRLRYQLLQSDAACETTADWSRPVSIDCRSACGEVRALSVSPMSGSRILVAVQQRDTASRDQIVIYSIDLANGSSVQHIPTHPYVDPEPVSTDVYPFKVATAIANGTQVAVASTCDADLQSSCGVRFWTISPDGNTLTARGLANPMRWLRVASGDNHVAAVGIDGSDVHGAVLDLAGGVTPFSRNFTVDFPPRSANPDAPSVDVGFLASGDILLLFFWTDNAGTAEPQLCPYLYDSAGQLQQNASCMVPLPGAATELSATTHPDLSLGDGEVAVVARAGNTVLFSAWSENQPGTWGFPVCGESSGVPNVELATGSPRAAASRRTAAVAPRLSSGDDWLAVVQQSNDTLGRRLSDTSCGLGTWANHDDSMDAVLDLHIAGGGPWLTLRRGRNGTGTTTLVTLPNSAHNCLPVWNIPGAGLNQLVPLGAALP